MHSTASSATFTVLTFLLAGAVKGVIGMGLPTVALGLLAEVMRPAQAAAVLLIPSFVTNVWQLAAGPNCLSVARRLWPMMAGILLGTWAGAGFLARDQGDASAIALGAALVAYASLGLIRIEMRVPRRWESRLSLPMGIVTGLVTGATGVSVVPAAPYLGALGMAKDELVQALGLSFTVSILALGGSLLAMDQLHGSATILSLLALPPAILGMVIGQRLRDRANPAVFRLCFFCGLFALGAEQMARHIL